MARPPRRTRIECDACRSSPYLALMPESTNDRSDWTSKRPR
jgi:hypothetical protein